MQVRFLPGLPARKRGEGSQTTTGNFSERRDAAITAVVPVLNDARPLATLLQALAGQGIEVIVVDGGSRDDPARVCRRFSALCLRAGGGRAAQMRVGAARARGRAIWFLHADAGIAAANIAALRQALAEGARWGRFDVQLSGAAFAFRVIGLFMNQRSRLSGICTGDQGIFVSRRLLEAVGGMPDQPLMEDIELSKRLRRLARPRRLRRRIGASSRRWERDGILRTVLLMWSLRLRYSFGAAPEALRRRYYPRPRIAVFARAPQRGSVKRRLAAALGSDAALAAHIDLVEGTLAALRSEQFDCELWFAGARNECLRDWSERYGLPLFRQSGADLGARMLNALRRGARIVVGTDIPALNAAYAASALAALREADVVIGPVEDGGYCLIGMNAPRAELFDGIEWGASDVCSRTIAKATDLGLRVATLQTLWDVDDAAGNARWRALPPSGGAGARVRGTDAMAGAATPGLRRHGRSGDDAGWQNPRGQP